MMTQATQCDDEWANLANAIVLQAVEDYRETLKRLRKHPDDSRLIGQQKQIERFFAGAWFRKLTDVNGRMLAEALRGEGGGQ